MAKRNRRNFAKLIKKLKSEQRQQMRQMLGQMGIIGPGANQPGLPPGAMMQPPGIGGPNVMRTPQAMPPIRVNNPGTFFGGQ